MLDEETRSWQKTFSSFYQKEVPSRFSALSLQEALKAANKSQDLEDFFNCCVTTINCRPVMVYDVDEIGTAIAAAIAPVLTSLASIAAKLDNVRRTCHNQIIHESDHPNHVSLSILIYLWI